MTAGPAAPRHPAVLRPGDVTMIVCLFAGLALVRSWDYLTPGAHTSAPVMETMRLAMPLQVWGVLIGVPALMLYVGMLTRAARLVWIAHAVLAALYAALAVSLGVEYVQRPWFDGIRSATALVAPAAFHALLAVRSVLPGRGARGR